MNKYMTRTDTRLLPPHHLPPTPADTDRPKITCCQQENIRNTLSGLRASVCESIEIHDELEIRKDK